MVIEKHLGYTLTAILLICPQQVSFRHPLRVYISKGHSSLRFKHSEVPIQILDILILDLHLSDELGVEGNVNPHNSLSSLMNGDSRDVTIEKQIFIFLEKAVLTFV